MLEVKVEDIADLLLGEDYLLHVLVAVYECYLDLDGEAVGEY